MVVIKSATYGDAYSSTDVQSSLAKQVKDGALSIKVNSSIVPLVDSASGARTVSLSNAEKKDILNTASESCGTSDQTCLEIKTRELAEAKLKAKLAETTRSTVELIAGKYLAVEYVDENGRPRKVKVPEGQELQLGTLGKKSAGTPPIDLKAALSPATQTLNAIWSSTGYGILVFVYVSSILITWMTVRKSGSRLIAYGLTAVSAIIPYSGVFIAIGGPAVAELYRVLRARYAQNRAALDAVSMVNPLENPLRKP